MLRGNQALRAVEAQAIPRPGPEPVQTSATSRRSWWSRPAAMAERIRPTNVSIQVRLWTEQSEAAAGSVGLSAARAKLRVFAVSAAIAGFGGILLAVVNRSVTADSVPAQLSLTWLAIVVLMGIRRPAGALLAAFVFVLSPELIHTFTESARIEQIFFGLGAIQLASSPDGVLSAPAKICDMKYRVVVSRTMLTMRMRNSSR